MSNAYKFKYKGYTFRPVGYLAPIEGVIEAYAAMMRMRSDTSLGLQNYGSGNKGWNYKGFYRAVPEKYKDAEIFYCEETGKNYVPSDKELMIWTGSFKAIDT